MPWCHICGRDNTKQTRKLPGMPPPCTCHEEMESLRARVAELEGFQADLTTKLGRVERLISRADTYGLTPQAVLFLRGCIE